MIFRANDKNSQVVVFVQVLLSFVAIPVLISQPQNWYWFAILGFFIFCLHFCHHAGLHRYFAHGSYKLNKFWHIFITFASCLVTFGSPIGYTLAHRAHHKFSDTEKDPHNPKIIGNFNTVFFRWNMDHASFLDANGLKDKWIRIAHEYYILIPLTFYILLLLIDYRLALCYNIGVTLAFLAVGYVNTYCHIGHRFTYKNFETNENSQNDLIAGLLGGEWHNNHHKYPKKYNQRVRWWEFDLTAWMIKFIEKK